MQKFRIVVGVIFTLWPALTFAQALAGVVEGHVRRRAARRRPSKPPAPR